jgi:hypothetical protein
MSAPARAAARERAGAWLDKRWRDFRSVWVDYNRGIGQMREWFIKGYR